MFPVRVDEYEALLGRQAIWLKRTKGIGLLSAEDAIALGRVRTGAPRIESTGIYARSSPTSPTTRSTSTYRSISTATSTNRYKVRMDEMRESTRIVQQCLDGMPEGPWIVDDRKIVLPPRHELHTSMESLIHHFKLVTEGCGCPRARCTWPARGELGCYVVSDGGSKPWRVKFRAPPSSPSRRRRPPLRDRSWPTSSSPSSAPSTRSWGTATVNGPRGPLRRDPDDRGVHDSAVMPALRLAQERYGWLPPDAFREVGEALDLTPAYLQGGRGFYDMFLSSPWATHDRGLHNVSCALVGAQQVLEAFEGELGVHAGETTADEFTLHDQLRGRLRLGRRRLRRPPLSRAGQARGRARHRRGAPQWLRVTGR